MEPHAHSSLYTVALKDCTSNMVTQLSSPQHTDCPLILKPNLPQNYMK